MECYSAMEKSEMMAFSVIWMDLNIIILGEVGQKDRDRYHVMSLICEFFLKKGYKWTFFQDRNRLTVFEIKLLVTRWKTGGHGGLGNWDWLGICALPCRTWITDKDLLYNTGTLLNILRWPIWEKNLKKNGYIYVYICGGRGWFTLLYTWG